MTVALKPYLLHINPYFVQRHYHNWKESSKHYYMGTQRIASELMGAPFDSDGLADPPLEDPSGMEKTQSGSSYPGSGAFGALSAWSSFDTLLQRLDITTDPNFWDGLQSLIPYQDYFLESQYHDLQEGCETGETQQGPNKTQTPNPPNTPNPECLCANSPFYAWEIHGIECNEYRLLYWYHPDYLGHNEFITDNSGLPYQYFHYSAISRRDFERKPNGRSAMLARPSPAFRRGGETLVEDNAHYGQFSSPYRFNAKELDQETGNYYYGTRYYNPTWSVWLGVDPLAGAYPHLTPYNFVENNPIRLVDPTGLEPEEPEASVTLTSNTVISGIVDENNTTHVNQTTINSVIEKLEDGSFAVEEVITEVTNQVKNSDGSITKGCVNTYIRTGTIDTDGNVIYGERELISSRDQGKEEFEDLDAWTEFISHYSANNKENYNVQSFNKGTALTTLAGSIGTLPLTIFGGGSINLASNISQVLKALKIPLSISSATATSGSFLAKDLGPNNDYLQIYGVSQTYNGIIVKKMKQPKTK